MSQLHTFGCSITQGFALPDTIKPLLDSDGVPLSDEQVQQQVDAGTVRWDDMHILKPSQFAWPQQLADHLGIAVHNHARRGACFHQIARQVLCHINQIKPEDVVIVMWTYLSRLSLQWPARTSVPYNTQVDPQWGWQTVRTGFNKFLGLSPHPDQSTRTDEEIEQYIQQAVQHTYLTDMGTFHRYYTAMIQQQSTHLALTGTGARIIHLSVEPDSCTRQLEQSRESLPHTLSQPWQIPKPTEWYTLEVDHQACDVILDPSIPPAEIGTHPSVSHHRNFAVHIQKKYFSQ